MSISADNKFEAILSTTLFFKKQKTFEINFENEKGILYLRKSNDGDCWRRSRHCQIQTFSIISQLLLLIGWKTNYLPINDALAARAI